MKNLEPGLFRALLADVFASSIKKELSNALSESDYLSVATLVEDATKRSISGKTLRAYVRQALAMNDKAISSPSPYHLETLAQYALNLSDRRMVKGTPSWFQYQQKRCAEDRPRAEPKAQPDNEPAARLDNQQNNQPEVQPGDQPVAVPVLRERKPARRRMLLWLLLFSLTGAGGLWWALKPVRTQPFSENFNRTHPDSLRARGWQFLDYDSGRFARQLRPDSMLTLWTLLGDYWVKDGEQRKVTNMLVHKVDGDCFTVTVKVRDFDFYQCSQQVGIFLLDEKLDPKYWSNIHISFADYLTIADSGVLQVLLAYQENGQVMYAKRHSVFLKGETKDGIKTAWLSMLVDHQDVCFSIKKYYEWWPFSEWTPPARINFKPAYIAVGAYQGWTNDDGTPKDADTVPVYIDELTVRPYAVR